MCWPARIWLTYLRGIILVSISDKALPGNAQYTLQDGRWWCATLFLVIATTLLCLLKEHKFSSSTVQLTVHVPTPPPEINSAQMTSLLPFSTDTLINNKSEMKLFLIGQWNSNYSLIMAQKLSCTMKNALRWSVIASVRYLYGLILHTFWWYIWVGARPTDRTNSYTLWYAFPTTKCTLVSI